MCEERSTLTRYEFLCGVCAMEWSHPQFQTPAFNAWANTIERPIRTRLVRIGEVIQDPTICSPCWMHRMIVPASFAVELTIDGDA